MSLFILISNQCNAKWNYLTSFYSFYSNPFYPRSGSVVYGCYYSPEIGTYDFVVPFTPSNHYYSSNITTNGYGWSNVTSGISPGMYPSYALSYKIRGQRANYILFSLIGYTVRLVIDGTINLDRGGILTNMKSFSPADTTGYFYLSDSILYSYNYRLNHYSAVPVDTFHLFNPVSIVFCDTLVGYLVGNTISNINNHLIYKTIDGGFNWSELFNDTTININTMSFLSRDIGFVAGNNGVIFKTTDGGLLWENVSTGNNHSIKKMDYMNDSIGLIAGDSGFVMTTINGGQTWNFESTGHTGNVQKVYCFNDSIMYLISDNDVYKKNIYEKDAIDSVPDSILDFIIYPSPNNGNFTIEVPGLSTDIKQIELRIVDNLGQNIYYSNGPIQGGKTNVNLKGFSNGIYYLEVISDTKIYRGKLIVEY